MKEQFNQTKYIDSYRKKHKAQFNVDLNIDEKEELEQLLKINNLTKAQFLRNAIKILKSDNSSLITKKD
jgi:protein-arginine kinase activator protein McsA